MPCPSPTPSVPPLLPHQLRPSPVPFGSPSQRAHLLLNALPCTQPTIVTVLVIKLPRFTSLCLALRPPHPFSPVALFVQFGYYSGQLGDGAAMYLGEIVNAQGQRCGCTGRLSFLAMQSCGDAVYGDTVVEMGYETRFHERPEQLYLNGDAIRESSLQCTLAVLEQTSPQECVSAF